MTTLYRSSSLLWFVHICDWLEQKLYCHWTATVPQTQVRLRLDINCDMTNTTNPSWTKIRHQLWHGRVPQIHTWLMKDRGESVSVIRQQVWLHSVAGTNASFTLNSKCDSTQWLAPTLHSHWTASATQWLAPTLHSHWTASVTPLSATHTSLRIILPCCSHFTHTGQLQLNPLPLTLTAFLAKWLWHPPREWKILNPPSNDLKQNIAKMCNRNVSNNENRTDCCVIWSFWQLAYSTCTKTFTKFQRILEFSVRLF